MRQADFENDDFAEIKVCTCVFQNSKNIATSGNRSHVPSATNWCSTTKLSRPTIFFREFSGPYVRSVPFNLLRCLASLSATHTGPPKFIFKHIGTIPKIPQIYPKISTNKPHSIQLYHRFIPLISAGFMIF